MTAREFKAGDLHEEVLVENLTRTQLVMYSGASGDYNPIHTDELYTREAAGYPGVFAHGMLTMGMTGRAITNLAGAENVRKFGVRFTSQVWPGDTLTAATRVEAVREEGGLLPLTKRWKNSRSPPPIRRGKPSSPGRPPRSRPAEAGQGPRFATGERPEGRGVPPSVLPAMVICRPLRRAG